MNAIFTPSHVANFIFKEATNENIKVTQLKLLKLVYLLYGWVMAVLDKKLFDEPIEAWKLGPVVPSLYHEFKRFGDKPITDQSTYMDEEGNLSKPFIRNDIQIIDVMKKCWDVYKFFNAYELVNKTHEPDSPWVKYYDDKNKIHNKCIPDKEIKEYFVKKIGEYIATAPK